MSKSLKLYLLWGIFLLGVQVQAQGSSFFQAADQIDESFVLDAQGREELEGEREDFFWGLKDRHISIFESALNKEFLLRINTTFLHPVSIFNNGASRVVSFKKVGESLFLLEATDGLSVDQDVTPSLVLAEFPILEQGEGTITFDFNRGMQQYFLADSWHAIDFGWNIASHFFAVDVQHSYLDEIVSLDNHRMFIRQVAQIKFGLERYPIEVRYFLEPYRANLGFQVTRAESFDQVGFFSVEPRFVKDSIMPQVYATKFDLKKTLVFALSSNTPKEYRQAVRDGVLYWNQVFGEGVVKVVEAPEGVSAPHPSYNVIQWVDAPTFNFAYADAQHDPRTGEVLNAQIWFNSVFALGGKLRARSFLRQLTESGDGEKENSHGGQDFKSFKSIGMRGFEKKPLCLYHFSSHSGMEEVAQVVDLSDNEKVFEIASDYIRHVMAHEVGHVLGLRHNFAGSLGVSYTKEERQVYFSDYLQNLRVSEAVVPGSSVMDYLPFVESVFSGNQMREGQKKLLSYDHMAIHHLYQKGVEGEQQGVVTIADPGLDEYNRPLFCTDSHLSRYNDCQMGDVFGSPVEYAIDHFESVVRSLPDDILKGFIRAKAPLPGESPKPLSEVRLFPQYQASMLLRGQGSLLQLLTTQGALLQVERSFDKVDRLNRDRIEQVTEERLAQDFQRWGGVEKVLEFLGEDFVERQMFEFSQFLERNVEGKGFGRSVYSFSRDEQQFILEQAKSYYTIFEGVAHEYYLTNLKNLKNLRDTELIRDLARFLLKKSRHYLMHVTSVKEQGFFKRGTVHVPVDIASFTYETQLRSLAAGLLSRGRSAKNPYWGRVEKGQLRVEYMSFLDNMFKGQSFSELKEESLSPNLLPWYWGQKDILPKLFW